MGLGYHMDQADEKFFIHKDHFPDVIAALRDLASKPELMGGGSATQKRFIWIDMSYVKDNDIKTIFCKWRWDVSFDDDGNVFGINFNGSKIGAEEALFTAIAPFVGSGSYIEMRGGNHDMWRWTFSDGKLRTVSPNISWPE